MENTRNKPARRRLPLAVYLAFLLVAALAFTGASFASYKTVATGSDSARVARFVVTAKPVDGQSEDLTLDSTKLSAAYTFTVSNNEGGKVNETATSYDVVVTLPSALPNGVTMTLTRGTDTTATEIASYISNSNKTYTFSDKGMLFSAAVARPVTYILTFTAASDAESGELKDINITVNAEQVD